jgi:DNA-binding sugar fermentation-stimulating protein
VKPADEWDHEDFGFVFAFSPVKPIDPEYRQAYREAQMRWLECLLPF